MSKVLLAVNTLTSVNAQAYASHLNLAFRMGKETEDEFILFNGWRTSIDRFRNEAGKIALREECDYLLFLDDDVLVGRDTYSLLKKRMENPRVDIITPVVFIRSYPFKPMFFKMVTVGEEKLLGMTHYDDWKEAVIAHKEYDSIRYPYQLLEVAAIGFSCCLIRVELLKKIPPAWFVTGTDHTEDVYFCIKAKQYTDNKVGIFVDTTINSGHMLDSEFVSTDTIEALKHFYEELHPSLKEKNSSGDHDSGYLKRNSEALDRAEETTL
jgi:hypothetical protein